MNILDFSNPYSIAMFVTIIVLGAALIAVLIVFIVSQRRAGFVKSQIKNQSNSIRSFIIDKKDNTVRFFNRNDLRKVRKITIDEFYIQFPAVDLERLSGWIDELLENKKDVPNYLEIEVYTRKNRRNMFSILQVVDINYEQKLIHLDSYLFRILASTSKTGKKVLPSKKEDINKLLEVNSPFRGVTTAFKFVIVDKTAGEEINRLAFTHIKELALKYMNPPYRCLLEVTNGEFVIFDIKSTSHPSVLYYIHQITSEIIRFLLIQGINKSVKLGVGVVENRFFPHDTDKLIVQSRKMASVSIEQNKEAVWYEKNMEIVDPSDVSFRSEVEHIINEQKLRYTFRPVVSSSKQKVIGYESFVKPFDTFFNSIDELYEYAIRTEDDRELTSTILKNTLPIFANENNNPNNRLFINSKLDDRVHTISVIMHVPNANELHLALVYTEEDINIASNKDEDLVGTLKKIKAKGLEIALSLKDKNLILPSALYECFDFFFINLEEDANDKDVNTNMKLRSIAEKLLKYERPIIANNIPDWNDIELVVRSGIDYISSESLAPNDEMLLPINKKHLIKISQMLE